MTRCAIVDLDGTVYRGGTLIPGAREGLAALRAAGYQIRFVSNSPTSSPADYASKLRGMGVEADAEQVVSAGSATVAGLRERHPDDDIFVIGSAGLREQLRAGELSLTDDPAEGEALLVSWDPTFDYDDMFDALRLDSGVPFYGTDPDRTYPLEGGFAPGTGSIIGAVGSTIERDPDAVFGKPSTAMFETAVADLAVDPADCLVVGDKYATDVALGQRVGARTALVRTGVDLGDPPAGAAEPDHVIDSLGDVGSVLDR